MCTASASGSSAIARSVMKLATSSPKEARSKRRCATDEPAQAGFDPRMRCQIRAPLARRAVLRANAGGQRRHDGNEHDGTDDQHRDPELEQRRGLRTGRHLDVVQAAHQRCLVAAERRAPAVLLSPRTTRAVRVSSASSRLGAPSSRRQPDSERT
jgi:hypothetical protein